MLPVLVEIIAWSAKHDPETSAPPAFVREVEQNREALLVRLRASVD